MDNTKPMTSIIMLSYNTLTFTKLGLYSIKEFEPEWPYELIVMDQGSKDGSWEWLKTIDKAKWPQLKVVHHDYNLMFSRGNDIMRFFADEKSGFLLLLNNDVQAHKKGWMEERIAPMVNDPKVGATGTFGDCHDPKTGGKFYLDDILAVTPDAQKAQVEKDFFEKCVHPNGKIREITGWSMGTRMKLWDELRGLRHDGRYKHMWSDSEYCIQTQLKGYTLALQGYNDKMTHFSGLSHAAINNPAVYDKRAEAIKHHVQRYESQQPNLLITV